MNTQNVKTAAQKPSERWVKEESTLIEQQALLDELLCFKNESRPEEETGQWLLEQLMVITKNVLDHGVVDWYEPKLKYSVAKYWIKAITVVPDLYGELGAAAIAFVRKRFEDSLCFEVAMARENARVL